jgi:hypothetical protein
MKASVSIAGTGAGSALTRRNAGSRLRLGFGRLISPLEVGGVPAIALKLKTGGGQLFGETFCVAFGAGRQQGIADFLHDIFLKAAAGAAISVDRHGNLQNLINE